MYRLRKRSSVLIDQEIKSSVNYEIIDESALTNSVAQYKDLCEDIQPSFIPSNLDDIERQIERLKQRWGEFTYLIGQRLKYIVDNKLYEQNNYPNFKTYVNIALKMAENNAYYYISVFHFFTEEQTRMAGSKLKLIIPFLNKIKSDKSLPESLREIKIKAMRDELFYKIYKKSYRDAEKVIKEVKSKVFNKIADLEFNKKKLFVKSDRIVLLEDNEDVKNDIIALIKNYYGRDDL